MFFALRAENLQISQTLDRSKQEVAQSQAHCNDLGRYLEHPQCTRDEVFHSPELEWMHMEQKPSLNVLFLVVEKRALMYPPGAVFVYSSG